MGRTTSTSLHTFKHVIKDIKIFYYYMLHSRSMKEEILPISFLRFFAAFSVLAFHITASLLAAGYIPTFFSFFNLYTQYGYLGVNLFFLISGFVIALSAEGRTLGQFVSSRFIRLFPVFWLCVTITSLFTLLLGNETLTLPQYLANLTMRPHLYSELPLIDGSYWTLELELMFYFAIACIIVIRTYISFSVQKAAILMLIPMSYYTFIYNPHTISLFGDIALTFLSYFGLRYAPYFLAGIFMYELYKKGHHYSSYFGIILCYTASIFQEFHTKNSPNNTTIVSIYITLFFIFFIAIALKKITNTSFRFLGRHHAKLLTTLGAATYPLYLLHNKITQLLIETYTKHNIPGYVATPLLCITLFSLVFLVNIFDIRIRNLWKHSSIIKNILERNNIHWLRKIL